jgi:acyl carrier protein
MPPQLDDALVEDLGADSIDLVTLLVSLETAISSKIDDRAIDGNKTLKDFVDLIEELQVNEVSLT